MAKILIIEDEEDLGSLLKMSLEDAGYDVDHYLGAEEALVAYKEDPADIVITDMIIKQSGKPVAIGGLSVSFRVKDIARKNGWNVSVIAISGVLRHPGMENILVTAQQLGADAALAKPFAPGELLEVIDSLLPEE